MKTKNIIQAYRQAPWRMQLQWIGIFLLILVSISAIAGVYLSLSGKAAVTGRRIQRLEFQVSALELEINDLASQLAYASSARVMRERADALNMVQRDPAQAVYLEVPGYSAESFVLAPAPSVDTIPSPAILPEFTASLWDWLGDKLAQLPGSAEVTPEVQP
jgi:cell division protein FtsL